MNPSDPHLPVFDYELSPYTGWTRAHWEYILARMTYGYAKRAERSGSPARVLYPEDDVFGLRETEHFFGLGAERWFNTPS